MGVHSVTPCKTMYRNEPARNTGSLLCIYSIYALGFKHPFDQVRILEMAPDEVGPNFLLLDFNYVTQITFGTHHQTLESSLPDANRGSSLPTDLSC